MSYLILKVDGLVGTAVKQIARDLISMAGRLDCGVECNVNGVLLLAFPGTPLKTLEQDYKRGLAEQETK